MKVKVLKPFLFGDKEAKAGKTIEVEDWKATVLANKGYVAIGKEKPIEEEGEEKPVKKGKKK